MSQVREPVVLFDPFPRNEAMVFTPDVEQALRAQARVETHFGSRAPGEWIEARLPEIDIIVGQTAMDARRLQMAPHLRAILNVKANWEPNIDYAAAQARGIHVLSAAPAMAPAVAEACVGYAIALSRRMVEAGDHFRAGTERYGIAGNADAYSLYGAEIGFIGYGNLGRELAPLLRPFGGRISVYDPWLSNRFLEVQGVVPATLEQVLANSRFLFILAGHTAENEGFIGPAELDLIPHDASVVLASRAEVVDFDAFVQRASSGHFRAAIDVYPQEPVPADAPWRQAGNILFTAHLAGGMQASYARIRDMMLDDITQILAGQPPLRMQHAVPQQAAQMRSR